MADAKNLEEVRAVFAKYRDDIIARYHASGAGVGRGDDGGYAIVVYLESGNASIAATPIEGVPLKFEVTGRFRPL